MIYNSVNSHSHRSPPQKKEQKNSMYLIVNAREKECIVNNAQAAHVSYAQCTLFVRCQPSSDATFQLDKQTNKPKCK